MQLWANAKHAGTAFLRWILKAEDVAVKSCEADWALLAGMESGAEKGVAAAENITYEEALGVCDLVSQDVWAASGAPYELGDLVCFLCLSQNAEVIGRPKLPQPAPPVTVASDLGSILSRAQVPCIRPRWKTSEARPSRRAFAASFAAGSGAASPAGPPARRRPRWRADVVRATV